ncbi:MAG: enoyl-CoA hydratase/isomerase family protein [Candidatus Marinimicrobia bacterium]|nr:enoyl-CoA hydratase/isomerase family protein [Candidatus Neomarinimicrobiota bacterium]
MAAARWKYINIAIEERIAVLTISRPPVNALSVKLVTELQQATDHLAEDDSSVVVVCSGQPHFSAGADLKERAAMDDTEAARMVTNVRNCFQSIAELPQPSIAAVNGAAIGGGAELALACDLRIMSDNVRFGLSEVSLGIIPGAGGTQRLPRLIGAGRALDLIYTGRIIDARECLILGLADRLVTNGRLHDSALALATEMAANAPLALRAAKRAVREGMEAAIAEGLAIEGSAYDSLIGTADRIEGLAAFKEKRPPRWKGE